METWRTILDYPFYEVSDCGNVRRRLTSKGHPAGRILRLATDSDGYSVVTLYRDGTQRTRKVHQLVMAAFAGPRPSGMVTNHLDANRSNNRFENLEYVTPQGNVSHAQKLGRCATGVKNGTYTHPEKIRRGEANGRSTVRDYIVRQIKLALLSNPSPAQVAHTFGVSRQIVTHIKQGRTARHISVDCGQSL